MVAKFKLTSGRRWLLFAGDNYYPSGGVSDFVGSFRNTRQAVEALHKVVAGVSGSWAQIVCAESGDRHDFEIDGRGGVWLEVESRDRWPQSDEAEDGA